VIETEEEFRDRCERVAHDAADEEASKLRDRFDARRKRVADRIADLDRRARELEVDVSQRKQQEFIAGAGELLSMFLGGRRSARSLSGFASRRSQTRRTSERLESASEKRDQLDRELADIEEELAAELTSIDRKWSEIARRIEPMEVGLESDDIRISGVTLLWIPTPR
jgi:hypothetical protein